MGRRDGEIPNVHDQAAAYTESEHDPAWPDGFCWSEAEGRPVYRREEPCTPEQRAVTWLRGLNDDADEALIRMRIDRALEELRSSSYQTQKGVSRANA